MRGRLTLELDFDSGDYTLEVKNLDHPGTGVPLEPLRDAFEAAMADLSAQATRDPAVPAPQPMDAEDSVTSGRIRLKN